MRELQFGSIYDEFKINKNGDTIKVPVGDNSFRDRFLALMKSWEHMGEELQKKEDELLEGVEGFFEQEEIKCKLEDEFTERACKDVDAIFGEGTLQKCYPDAQKLNLSMVSNFFSITIPAIMEARSEREGKISRQYNNNRKGARSK